MKTVSIKREIKNEVKKMIPFPMRSYIKYHIIDRRLSPEDRKILDYLKAEKIEKPVLLSAFKKSGNTWARFVIFNYFNILTNNAQKTLTFSELASLQVHDLESGSTEPFRPGFPAFYHTHYPYRKVFDSFYSVVYLYRNPLDTLISYYHMVGNRDVPFNGFPIREVQGFHSIDNFVMNQLPYWIYHYKSTLLKGDCVLSYEKMRKDPFRQFAGMFVKVGFGLNEAALKKSIEISSFESIKEMGKKTNQAHGICNPKSFKGEFTRSGKSRQYLEVLKPETLDRARKMLRRYRVDIEL